MKYKLVAINTSFLIVLSLILSSFAGSLAVVGVSSSNRLLPIYSVETKEKKIAITFDAAWEPTDTDELIEILKKYNAKATVFCVGNWVKKFPEDALKFHENGHELANHSQSHKMYSSISREEVKEELLLCNKAIESLTGSKVKLCRAPSGDYDNKSIEIAESLGMKMIQWNLDSLDYRGLSVDEIYKRLTENPENGSILLFHNGVKNTAPALSKVLEFYSNNGFQFVTVSELIYKDDYKIDHTGRQVIIDN